MIENKRRKYYPPTPCILARTTQLRMVARRGRFINSVAANDVRVTNLQFLSEFCHFSHFNDKRPTNMTFLNKSEEFADVL